MLGLRSWSRAGRLDRAVEGEGVDAVRNEVMGSVLHRGGEAAPDGLGGPPLDLGRDRPLETPRRVPRVEGAVLLDGRRRAEEELEEALRRWVIAELDRDVPEAILRVGDVEEADGAVAGVD